MKNITKVLEVRLMEAVNLGVVRGRALPPLSTISVAKEKCAMEVHPAGVLIDTGEALTLVPYANIKFMRCVAEGSK